MIQFHAILNSTDKQTSPSLVELAYQGTMGKYIASYPVTRSVDPRVSTATATRMKLIFVA